MNEHGGSDGKNEIKRREKQGINGHLRRLKLWMRQDLNYLGVVLEDRALRFKNYLEKVNVKAGGTIRKLARLMLNVMILEKRRLLPLVAQFSMLYEVEIWTTAMKVENYRKVLLVM